MKLLILLTCSMFLFSCSSTTQSLVDNNSTTTIICVPSNSKTDCPYYDDSLLISHPNKGLIVGE